MTGPKANQIPLIQEPLAGGIGVDASQQTLGRLDPLLGRGTGLHIHSLSVTLSVS